MLKLHIVSRPRSVLEVVEFPGNHIENVIKAGIDKFIEECNETDIGKYTWCHFLITYPFTFNTPLNVSRHIDVTEVKIHCWRETKDGITRYTVTVEDYDSKNIVSVIVSNPYLDSVYRIDITNYLRTYKEALRYRFIIDIVAEKMYDLLEDIIKENDSWIHEWWLYILNL